jgi:hypothetical protein
MLPFCMSPSKLSSLRLYQLEDGRFQAVQDGEIAQVVCGFGRLLF